MGETNESTLKGMVDAIVKDVHPEETVAFRSPAQGDSAPTLDLDLTVIESNALLRCYVIIFRR